MTWRQRLFVVLLWIFFGGLWVRAYRMTTAAEVANAALYLILITAAYSFVIAGWVLHNRALFYRKGSRKRVRLLDHAPIHDELRTYIVAKTDLKKTQAITVHVAEGRKQFSDSTAA